MMGRQIYKGGQYAKKETTYGKSQISDTELEKKN
jgi:hypothetical protein